MRNVATHRHTTTHQHLLAGARRMGPETHTLGDLAGDFVRDMYSFADREGLQINRNVLLAETAQFIQRISDTSDTTAQMIAGKAIGLYESWNKPVSFDMSHSTSHTIFLRDASTGRTHVVTAVELAKLLANHDGNLI